MMIDPATRESIINRGESFKSLFRECFNQYTAAVQEKSDRAVTLRNAIFDAFEGATDDVSNLTIRLLERGEEDILG